MKSIKKENTEAKRPCEDDLSASAVFGRELPTWTKLVIMCGTTFVVVAAVSLITARIKGLFPFGEYPIYFSDLVSEYSTFLEELWQKVHLGGSLFYSWKTVLGTNFWGNLLYYTSSPLNLIALLGKESAIDETIALLIYLRQALAATFMCLFLCLRRGGRPSFAGSVGGVLYGCCGWFCGYYFCTIWLDAYMLLPLLLLGIEHIIDSGRPILYTCVLTVMLFSNFYAAYFVCVFAVIYWLYYFFSCYSLREYIETEGGKKIVPFFRTRFVSAGALFAASSVLSALVLSVLFIPLLLQMSLNEANFDMVSAASWFKNITQQISSMFSGSNTATHQFRHYPAIYTGVLALVAAPLYFFLKNVSRREKIMAVALFGLMVLSFNLPFLDYAWHGFRYPTNYPFREAYFFSVILIILVARVLQDVRSISPKAFISFAAVGIVLAISAAVELIFRNDDTIAITAADVVVTAILFVLFCIMLVVLRCGRREGVNAATAFILIFCLIDGTYTFSSNVRLIKWTQPVLERERGYVEQLLEKEDDSDLFHRTELCTSWLTNDGAYFGYNGIRQSSSMTATSTFGLLNDFGLDSNRSNFDNYNMQTPVFNSIFGVRYLVERQPYAEYIGASYLSSVSESYRIMDSIETYTLYQFSNALSLGFCADQRVTTWDVDAHDAFENQNGFYAAAAGSEEAALIDCGSDADVTELNDNTVLTVLDGNRYALNGSSDSGEIPGVRMLVPAKYSGMLYVFAEITDGDFSVVHIEVESETPDGENVSFESISDSFFGAVCSAQKGTPVRLTVRIAENKPCTLRIRVFQTDSVVFARQHEMIANKGQLHLTEFSDTHFKGSVDVTEDDKVLCVTVPYDPGWKVTLDGKTLFSEDYSLIDGAIYAIPVEKGLHTVAFDYSLRGLSAGIAVSCCSLLLSAVFMLSVYRKKRR